MTVKCGSCVFLAGIMALMMGCRTAQPDLKPPKTPEVLNGPPSDARYDSSVYPKAAFDSDQRKLESLDKGPGTGSPGKAGGMSGMGGR